MAAYAAAPVLTSIVGGAKEKEPFSSSLVGYWDMDSWNATHVMDRTSNINHGLVYDANRSNGKLGYGMVFDGVDDYVKISHSPELNLTYPFTILFWAKYSTTSNTIIIEKNGKNYSVNPNPDKSAPLDFFQNSAMLALFASYRWP